MGRSQETFGKKEVRTKNEKKRKEKEKKREQKKSEGKKSFDDMIAYVDEFGRISATPPDPDKKSEVDSETIELSASKNRSSNDPARTKEGTVMFFNESKGFGFIRDAESGEKIFVHKSNLVDPVRENDRVTFTEGRGPGGASALNVKLAGN